MSVWYLELDDEITDAVARLRAAKDDRVVFVVPAGSRIGTGRINFRLLAREAEQRGLHIALVSGDVQVRGLAASAGLPTYATVGESERGEAAEREARAAGTVPGAAPTLEASATPAPGTGSTALVSTAPGAVARIPTAPPRRRTRRRSAALAVGALALVGVVGGGALFAAYQSVPTATIRLVLSAHDFGPEELTLTVSPTDPTDAATGVVQGVPQVALVTAQVPITATEPAGLDRSARGSVVFTNDSDLTAPIGEGTIVATPTGVRFETQDPLQVPAHETMEVGIRAVEPGAAGNVEAGTITVIESPDVVAQLGPGGGVTNPQATQDGEDSTSLKFSAGDYDSAVAALREQLAAGIASAVPAELPQGFVAYPGTGVQNGEVTIDQARDDVVGRLGTESTLTGSLKATVLTADGVLLDHVARQMLGSLASPATLLPDATVDLGAPTVTGDHATYQATGSGRVYELPVTIGALKEQVRSRTIAEAQDILDDYGQVTITLSPDFLPTLPDDPNRIRLDVEAPEPGATIAP